MGGLRACAFVRDSPELSNHNDLFFSQVNNENEMQATKQEINGGIFIALVGLLVSTELLILG